MFLLSIFVVLFEIAILATCLVTSDSPSLWASTLELGFICFMIMNFITVALMRPVKWAFNIDLLYAGQGKRQGFGVWTFLWAIITILLHALNWTEAFILWVSVLWYMHSKYQSGVAQILANPQVLIELGGKVKKVG